MRSSEFIAPSLSGRRDGEASASELDAVGGAVGIADGPEVQRVKGGAKFVKPCAAVGEGVVGTAGLGARPATGVPVLGDHAGEVIAVAGQHVHVEIAAITIPFRRAQPCRWDEQSGFP